MNAAYKHLDSKLKIASLTVAQWCGVIGGVVLAVAWGSMLHPFSGMFNTVLAMYIGGVPALLTWLSVESEIDVILRARAFARWRRGAQVYLPGAGQALPGYVLEAVRSASEDADGLEARPSRPTLETLWE